MDASNTGVGGKRRRNLQKDPALTVTEEPGRVVTEEVDIYVAVHIGKSRTLSGGEHEGERRMG
jgi:hypothetical protein